MFRAKGGGSMELLYGVATQKTTHEKWLNLKLKTRPDKIYLFACYIR
jgi:hypothetical protein